MTDEQSKKAKSKDLKYHPACSMFPKLTGTELEALVEDIRANGQIDQIVLLDKPGDRYNGTVLDGRNRLQACKKADVEPSCKKLKVEDPLQFVISANIARRHMDKSQRAMLALDLLHEFRKDAQQRMKKGVKDPSEKVREGGKATEKVAKLVGVSDRYVEHAIKVSKKGCPRLVEWVKQGKHSLTLSLAIKIIKKFPKFGEQEELLDKNLEEIRRIMEGKKSLTGKTKQRQSSLKVTIRSINNLINNRLKAVNNKIKKASPEDRVLFKKSLIELRQRIDETCSQLD